MIRGLAAALVALVLLAAPAGAEPATRPEVRQLAARAADDPAALARLRRVDEVDGRAVDVGAALRGSRVEVQARLRTLAADVPVGDGTGARADARRILAGPDFREHHPPRPLLGPLRWIGDRLRPVVRPVSDFFADLDLRGWLTAGLAALVVLAAAIAGAVVANRRTLAVLGDAAGRAGVGRRSPAALERDADRAEAAGDHEAALRLRFQAGLLRLDAAGALRYRPSLTTGSVTRQVRSATLVELAATHDEVVYGERPARADDVDQAKRRWPDVLAEAGPR
jgi:hypothetical protein